MKRMKRDQQRMLDWIREHGHTRGYTLGRGKPHDNRTVQSLIDAHWIKPIGLSGYAVRGEEDRHGLALLIDPETNTVCGATLFSIPIEPLTESECEPRFSNAFMSALENGTDTAWELYPNDKTRRDWMEAAIARATWIEKHGEIIG